MDSWEPVRLFLSILPLKCVLHVSTPIPSHFDKDGCSFFIATMYPTI